jgi:hypothetical protein
MGAGARNICHAEFDKARNRDTASMFGPWVDSAAATAQLVTESVGTNAM